MNYVPEPEKIEQGIVILVEELALVYQATEGYYPTRSVIIKAAHPAPTKRPSD